MKRIFYINGEQRSEKAFYSFKQDDPLIHYVILELSSELNKDSEYKTIEWGRVPKLIIRKKEN